MPHQAAKGLNPMTRYIMDRKTYRDDLGRLVYFYIPVWEVGLPRFSVPHLPEGFSPYVGVMIVHASTPHGLISRDIEFPLPDAKSPNEAFDQFEAEWEAFQQRAREEAPCIHLPGE